MTWTQFPDSRINVDGLYWFPETTPRLCRFPMRMKGVLREAVWNLSQHTSGGRLRFATTSSDLRIRATYHVMDARSNFSLIGAMGMDIYIDGAYWKSDAPSKTGEKELVLLENAGDGWKEVCVYLPIYSAVEVHALGASKTAQLRPAAPFVRDRPVVFYGSSITQGGCASRPGMTYQAMLGRNLNTDFINLGFSGNGLGEPELARIMTEIDAECYVLDLAVNLQTPEAVEEVYAPFLRILREAKPKTVLVAITPIHASRSGWACDAERRLPAMRKVVEKAVKERINGGDSGIVLVDGLDLLGPELPDGFVDGVHPNDLGFKSIADGLTPIIKAVLDI